MKKIFHFTTLTLACLASVCTIISFIDSPTWFKIFHQNGESLPNIVESYPIQPTDTNLILTARTKTIETPIQLQVQAEKSNFFITFFKTVAVIIVVIYTLIGCMFVGIYEFFINLFTNNGFSITHSMWNWAWDSVALEWYMDKAVTWHLYLSVTIWLFIGSTRD